MKTLEGQGLIAELKSTLPANGLFRDRDWRWSDRPYALGEEEVRFLRGLGKKLAAFLRAADKLYRASVAGQAPSWVAEWLDLGKPEEIVRLGREDSLKGLIPRVLRPDLIRTEAGWSLTEIDSVPGGVGLTAWLQEEYGKIYPDILGGRNGMRRMVEEILGEDGEVVISQEAGDYLPEWQWLVGKDRVKRAEEYQLGRATAYRFFEMFDWLGLASVRASWQAKARLEAPPKAYLEEKLWWALLWMGPLEDWWRKELGEGYFKDMRQLVPRAWPLRPVELPPEGVFPDLGASSWSEVESFSQKKRELMIKISGFSPRAWGSRGVFMGSDHPKERWVTELRRALGEWPSQPHLLQRYASPMTVTHPVYNEKQGGMEEGKWKMRLCPYYGVKGDQVELAGALATLCPTDKKIIHGMQDAVLAPVAMATSA